MTPRGLRLAIACANEFLARAADVETKLDRHIYEDGTTETYIPLDESKLLGALRRQSMELTRALAEMRKP